MGVFRVCTDVNPTDAPSKLRTFHTHGDVTECVKLRQAAWKGELNPFMCLDFLPRFAWRMA